MPANSYSQRDIIVLGGGHNALVAAFYLAKKGYKPLILERRDIIGGAAVTEEFHPGFKCSTVAHAGGPPLAQIVKDMQLARHGLEKLESPVRIFAPNPDGRALTLYTDAQRSAADIKKFSAKDAANYIDFSASLATHRQHRRAAHGTHAARNRKALQRRHLEISEGRPQSPRPRQKRNDAPDPLGPHGRRGFRR